MADHAVELKNSIRVESISDALNTLTAGLPGDAQVNLVDSGDNLISVASPDDLQALIARDPEPYVMPASGGLVSFLYQHLADAVPDEWRDLTLPPTLVLAKGRELLIAYALTEAQRPNDVRALASAMACDLGTPLPLPGANGWTAVHIGDAAGYSVEALSGMFCAEVPAMAPAGAADLGKLLDARILAPIGLDAPELQQELVISVGTNFKSVRWKNDRMSVAKLVTILARHPEGRKKDGPGFVLAEIKGDNRKKHAVSRCYGIGLDIDVGMPGAEIDAALAKLGCLAVRYTTFSHAKTASTFNKDKIVKWCARQGIGSDEAGVMRFLREESKWHASLLETAEYTGDEHEPEGLMACVSHAPMEKHRIVLPLAEAFDPTRVAKTHAEGMAMWAKVCKALARRLGDLPMDNSAVDPSRLFYFPRHAKGRPHETTVFGGPLFNWRTLDLDGKPAEAFDAALEREVVGAGGGGRSTTDAGRALGRWSVGAAEGFQIAEVLRDLAGDRVRTNGSAKIDIECPFDEDHSKPGDPEDRGCFAVNAGDGTSEIFTIKCQHDSCQGRTNLDFLGKMLTDEWFGREVLDDPNYNADLDSDDRRAVEHGRQTVERQDAARARYGAAIAALTPDATDEEAEAVARLIVEADLSTVKRTRAKEAVAVALKIGKRDAETLLRDARAAAIEAAEAGEAGPSAGRYADLAKAVPLPGREYGSYSYRPFAERAWVHSQDTRLWTPWAILGAVTYPDRDGVDGLRVRVNRVGGDNIDFDVPAEVTTDGARMKATLRSRGVGMTGDGMERLTGLAAQITPDKPIKAFGWGGWRESGTFLTPWGRAIGQDRSLSVSAEARPKGDEIGGTFEGWRAAIHAAFATGLRQLQLSACASYASPIIDLIRSMSGVLFLSGAAGAGKTTAHKVQASAWGDATPRRGLLASLDVSAQAPEVLLAQASGAGGVLDEVKHYKGSLQDLIFRISGDTGRSRMRQDTTGLRDGRAWRLLVSMSYERTVEHRIRVEDGEDVFGGLGARCLEVPADLTKLTREAMAPVDAIRTHFGHGGSRFVQALIDQGYAADPQTLESEVEALADKLLKDSPTDQRRAARLMAAIWKAGEIAQGAGLIPMEFPIAPPEALTLPPAEDATPDTASEPGNGRPLPQDLDALGQMIVQAWRLSREMESASADPTAKAVKALLRNLAMGRGVVHHGDAARPDTCAVRLHNFEPTSEAVFVIPNASLPAMLDGSADAGAVRKALRKDGLLITHKHDRGTRTVNETTWGHVPGFGPGPAIVIPVAKVQES